MPKPKASQVLLDRANENSKIEIICNTEIVRIAGDDHMTSIEVKDRATGEIKSIPVEGILVRIGLKPNTEFLKDVLELTPIGQVPVNENMETSIPGIFAAGDVRQYSPMQIATAVGDGVNAAMSCGRYIEANFAD
jgi:thioredoxin reductase (NADPH)